MEKYMSEEKLRTAIEDAIKKGNSRMAGRSDGNAIVSGSLKILHDNLGDRDVTNDFSDRGMESLQVRTKVMNAVKGMDKETARKIIADYIQAPRSDTGIAKGTEILVSDVPKGTDPQVQTMAQITAKNETAIG
jgi:hypothetical protein